jgi:hypothetical protein
MVPLMSFLSRQATESYRALLPAHLESTRRAVEATWSSLRFEGRPICTALEPLLLDARCYAQAIGDADRVFRALVQTARHVATRRGLSARTGAWSHQRKSTYPLVARLDAMPVAGRLRFIELNAIDATGSAPYGIGDIDPLNELFSGLPILDALRRQGFSFRSVDHMAALADTLIETHREGGVSEAPHIAVVDVSRGEVSSSSDTMAADPYLMRLIGCLLERGCELHVCDVATLAVVDGRLVTGDYPIDYVYLADETAVYLDTCPEDAPLLVAVREGLVGMADGYPLGGLLRDKGLFADLSDPNVGVELSEDLRDAVDACVPWTRRVVPGTTTFARRPVDLFSFIVDNREELVLKPTNAIGGAGVSLGWKMERAEWADALVRASGEDYVVQQRASGEKTRVTFLDGDTVTTRDVFFDLDPYVWGGAKVEGMWARLSASALLNLSAGHGSETAVFVVDSHE